MVEKRSWFTVAAHLTLIAGVLVVCFPLYVTLIASTHPLPTLLQGRLPLLPGGEAISNYAAVLGTGVTVAGMPAASVMLANSLVMALGICVGKLAISIIAAYAIV